MEKTMPQHTIVSLQLKRYIWLRHWQTPRRRKKTNALKGMWTFRNIETYLTHRNTEKKIKTPFLLCKIIHTLVRMWFGDWNKYDLNFPFSVFFLQHLFFLLFLPPHVIEGSKGNCEPARKLSFGSCWLLNHTAQTQYINRLFWGTGRLRLTIMRT